MIPAEPRNTNAAVRIGGREVGPGSRPVRHRRDVGQPQRLPRPGAGDRRRRRRGRRARDEDPDVHGRHHDARRRQPALPASPTGHELWGGRTPLPALRARRTRRGTGTSRSSSGPASGASLAVLQPVRPDRGRAAGEARRPVLQDRVVRDHRPAADPAGARSTGKPIIISTGMASVEEIAAAVEAARGAGATTSSCSAARPSYPAPPERLQPARASRSWPRCSACRSASPTTRWASAWPSRPSPSAPCLIEKHVTLDRADGGVDSAFSLEPAELALAGARVRAAWQALGSHAIGPADAEAEGLRFRRSLFVVEDVRAGDAGDRGQRPLDPADRRARPRPDRPWSGPHLPARRRQGHPAGLGPPLGRRLPRAKGPDRW